MEDANDDDDRATMMEINDNPPDNLRAALPSIVVAVVANRLAA